MSRYRLVIAMLVLVLVTTGCAKRPAMTQASAPAPAGAAGGSTAIAPSDQVRPTPRGGSGSAEPAPVTATREAPSEFEPVADLRDIHFAFDQYDIRPGDAKILDANVDWLKTNMNRLVVIEGHCDERGTTEYNLALGERRAKATLSYLVSHGVAATRITVISYGKERPLCTEHTEACWAKNRRAHFLVKRQ